MKKLLGILICLLVMVGSSAQTTIFKAPVYPLNPFDKIEYFLKDIKPDDDGIVRLETEEVGMFRYGKMLIFGWILDDGALNMIVKEGDLYIVRVIEFVKDSKKQKMNDAYIRKEFAEEAVTRLFGFFEERGIYFRPGYILNLKKVKPSYYY